MEAAKELVKVCQKFKKSVARLRVTLLRVTSFNEVVTLDVKEFSSKYVLWMVDIFTRFIQGKLITNKRADTIINAVNDGQCMNVGFPSVSFFADNIKLDELRSKLGLMVKFGPT